MNLQDSLRRARKLADEQNRDMVVGRDEAGDWTILPLSDARSDSLSPSLIVDRDGLRYPEDHALVAELIARQ